MVRRAFVRPPKLDYARPDRAPGDPQYDRRVVRDRRLGVRRDAAGDRADRLFARGRADRDDRSGLRRHPVRRLDRRPGADRPQRLDAGRRCATGCGGSTGCSRSRSSRASPTRRPRTCCRATSSLSLRDPLGRQAAARRSRPTAPPSRPGYGALSDFSPLHLLQLDACTKCGRCHEACPANATGRPLSPRDVILELREQPHPADAHAPGSAACWERSLDGKAERRAGFRCQRDRRGRRPRRDRVVVHAVQRVRRDLPGRDRAGADHQPAAPPAGRGGRARLQPAVDARGDPQVGQLVRREQAQARALDRRSSTSTSPTPASSRSTCSGSSATTRRSIPARSGSRAIAGAPLPRGRSRLRDPLRRRAQLGQRRAPGRRGGPVRVARRAEHRDDLGLRVQADRHQRPALAEHAAQRVPRPRRRVDRDPPHRAACSS